MQIVKTIAEARRLVSTARQEGKRIGFVPTMGALHEGHVSLMNAARGRCGYVVVSIFVNPTQFGPNEDFEKYPRDLDADAVACQKAGVDLIFAPSAKEMYPQENRTWVQVEQLTEPLCGARRPGHFRGVTTVCAKLFHIVGADMAFFGQKDAQQAIIIRRMVSDLFFPLEIVLCPTIRESDGLAVSSRNRYLNPTERKEAVLLFQALKTGEDLARKGEKRTEVLIAAMQQILGSSALLAPEYVEIVDQETLEPLENLDKPALVALAAKLGTTRLIDNIILDLNVPPGGV
ncbi:MAG: pantoate--beta-alanine ligase [Sedimentisphaerales bacterium]|nr:pantoate--beta-alanine ligase [Sedimentisphaerales bacterium]